jgi:hypothetical protein
LPSRLHPPPLLPFHGLPKPINGALWWLSDAIQNGIMLGPVNQARAILALQPTASFTQHLFGELENLIAADPDVLPPDPAWEERYPYIGFAFLADSSPLGAALEAWLDAGEPPVYVGFGSMTFGARERTASAVRNCLIARGLCEDPRRTSNSQVHREPCPLVNQRLTFRWRCCAAQQVLPAVGSPGRRFSFRRCKLSDGWRGAHALRLASARNLSVQVKDLTVR